MLKTHLTSSLQFTDNSTKNESVLHLYLKTKETIMFKKSHQFLSALAGITLVGALVWFTPVMHGDKVYQENSLPVELTRSSTNTATAVDPTETLKNLNNALANIAEKANPAVVTIKSKQKVQYQRIDPFAQFFGMPNGGRQTEERVREGLGSGVIVSKDGYILTNNHVVDGADELLVGLLDSETEYEAKVIGTDPQTDIAVLKVEGDDFPTLGLGNSDELRVGEIVIAVGSPLDAGLAHTVTMGIVSARGRANLQLAEYEDFIQTDAAINPGNSGGALVNLNGELIGINTAIASRSGGYQGIGFSIPINMARTVMEQLIKYGKVTRGYIGVYMQDINSKMAQALDLKSSEGVIVAQVEPNSPASRAGLKEGDVIKSFDGKKIKNSTELKNKVAATTPGAKAKIGVLRDGDNKDLTIVLDEKGGSGVVSESTGSNSISDQLKFEYSTLNSELARQYQVKSGVEGVVITSIDARSSAYRNGLREGDVILAVNKKKVDDVASFEKEVKKYKKGEAVIFRIIRQNVSLYFAFEF
ncbi:DegQ family serine endoprotease [bacterium]|nr:MAG: DegQ family serine endoprotease [bacterium]